MRGGSGLTLRLGVVARDIMTVQVVQTPSFIIPRDALIVTHNPPGWGLGVWTVRGAV